MLSANTINLLGEFQESEFGNWFSYKENVDQDFHSSWMYSMGYTSLVSVGPEGGQWRYAKVLKTVAHVVVDENEVGMPVVEVWQLKKHNIF
jgi:hypothetical protein